MLKSLLLPIVALIIAFVFLVILKRAIWRIKEAFPEPAHVVFAQVGFGALLKAGRGTSALHYTQKRADFVLTDRAFTVQTVIEIDDASHDGRGQQDNARDAMLKSAGYTVIRFGNIPDVRTLQRHVTAAEVGEAKGAEPREAPKKRLKPPSA